MTPMSTEDHAPPIGPPSGTQGEPALVIVHCGCKLLPAPKVLLLSQLPQQRDAPEGEGASAGSRVFGRDCLPSVGEQDGQISGSHFGIFRHGDANGTSYLLEDLGSRNGTFVDGQRLPLPASAPPKAWVKRAELRDGAILRVGNTVLVFRERFEGPKTPDMPCFEHQGERMIGPFGLRKLRAEVEALKTQRSPSTVGRLNVLLEAETGSGKEMLARFVAQILGRSRPFTPVNVPAVVKTLFASEFFGNGVWQPGVTPSHGIVGSAANGCIFMDEIHETGRDVHVQLLRFLQDRDYFRVGEPNLQRIADVLVVAATSLPLQQRAERDIFERLREVSLRLPPLRERTEDIPELCKELLQRQNIDVTTLPAEVEAIEWLLLQRWEGNIRELGNALTSILQRTQGTANPGLRWWAIEQLQKEGHLSPPPFSEPRSLTVGRILLALAASREPNESEAARQLGIDRSKLRRWRGLQ
jgi:hypothetical protein